MTTRNKLGLLYIRRFTSAVFLLALGGRDESLRQGQHTIELAASKAENVREAQMQAAEAIREMYKHVGWDVDIIWHEESVEPQVKGELLTAKAS